VPLRRQSTPAASLVATGSDEGYVGLWDRRAKDGAGGANVAFLRPAHAQAGDGKESSPGGRSGKPDGAECVTSLEVEEQPSGVGLSLGANVVCRP